MTLPNWFEAFQEVSRGGRDTLEWGLPEPWVHAEMYAQLKQRAAVSGWMPFSTEIPYVTFCPVQLPKSRDLRHIGAVKWVDLCLHREDHSTWCWFEFKVRHAGYAGREREADLRAMRAFRNDVVALIGFSAELTADTWSNPDAYTTAYWFERVLEPHTESLRAGHHSFTAAFLKLGGDLDETIWSEARLMHETRRWLARRSKQASRQVACPPISVTISPTSLTGGHSLVLCEWEESTC